MTLTSSPDTHDRTAATTDVAGALGRVLTPVLGGTLPVRLRAWDGSSVGPDDAPTVTIHTPDALRRLIYRPGELGLAQAYVTGEIDVEGDLLDGFRRVWSAAREHRTGRRLTPAVVANALRTAASLGAVGRPPGPP
ncbi:MAG: SAM-dependent methyltransferase, partial [Actinomycetes bacterium]